MKLDRTYTPDDHPQLALRAPSSWRGKRVFHEDDTVIRIVDRVAANETFSFLERCAASPAVWLGGCAALIACITAFAFA